VKNVSVKEPYRYFQGHFTNHPSCRVLQL